MNFTTYAEARVAEFAFDGAVKDLTKQEASEGSMRKRRETRAFLAIAKRFRQIARRKCEELGPEGSDE